MPELPDVQVFKEYFDATALHKTIAGIAECQDDLLENISCRNLAQRLVDSELTGTRRHGKYLFARIAAGGYLILHFGMTGFLKYFKDEEKTPGHTRLLLELGNGYHLAFDCQRKLGRVDYTDSLDSYVEKQELGPDALALSHDLDGFVERLAGHRGSIKGLLMNQKALAGLGNVYTDEVLFQVGMHPKTGANDLDDEQRRAIAKAARHVLETGIERRVGEKGWPESWLLPHRDEGQNCPRCSGRIERITVSGRAGYYCPGHQE